MDLFVQYEGLSSFQVPRLLLQLVVGRMRYFVDRENLKHGKPVIGRARLQVGK